MSQIIVLVEHDGISVTPSSLAAITAAEQLGRGFSLLVMGQDLAEVAASLRRYHASTVWVADDSVLDVPVADRYATVLADFARSIGCTTIIGTSSTFTKDILPRAAALLDWPMLSDVIAIEQTNGTATFQRPVSAGSSVATVALDSCSCMLTVRAAAFEPRQLAATMSDVRQVNVDVTALGNTMRFVSQERKVSHRPQLSESRIVVCGGRPLRDEATFEKLIGGLADALGGAIGCTRAAVDAGMAPNDCQIGQTGKIIAPDLYVAVGVSGSLQHVAGIKDARIVVAINKDPEAPMVQLATYSLVGDLFQIVPEWIAATQR